MQHLSTILKYKSLWVPKWSHCDFQNWMPPIVITNNKCFCDDCQFSTLNGSHMINNTQWVLSCTNMRRLHWLLSQVSGHLVITNIKWVPKLFNVVHSLSDVQTLKKKKTLNSPCYIFTTRFVKSPSFDQPSCDCQSQLVSINIFNIM